MLPRRYLADQPFTPRGEVLLSHLHIFLMEGLLDLPDATAPSVAAWVRAAMPYARRFAPDLTESALRRAIISMHRSWVSRERKGNRTVTVLTRHGEAILDGLARAFIRGYGPYRGLPWLMSRGTGAAARRRRRNDGRNGANGAGGGMVA